MRFHDDLPALVLLFIDPDSPTGRIRVERMRHGFEATERPSFELRPQAGGTLCSLLYEGYKKLCESLLRRLTHLARCGVSILSTAFREQWLLLGFSYYVVTRA